MKKPRRASAAATSINSWLTPVQEDRISTEMCDSLLLQLLSVSQEGLYNSSMLKALDAAISRFFCGLDKFRLMINGDCRLMLHSVRIALATVSFDSYYEAHFHKVTCLFATQKLRSSQGPAK